MSMLTNIFKSGNTDATSTVNIATDNTSGIIGTSYQDLLNQQQNMMLKQQLQNAQMAAMPPMVMSNSAAQEKARYKQFSIHVKEIENGYVVNSEGREYVVGQDDKLLDIIARVLVDKKLDV